MTSVSLSTWIVNELPIAVYTVTSSCCQNSSWWFSGTARSKKICAWRTDCSVALLSQFRGHCVGPGILLSFGFAVLMQKCGHILQLVVLCWSHSFLSWITWCKLPPRPGMHNLNRSLKWKSRKTDQHLWLLLLLFLLWGISLKTVTIELLWDPALWVNDGSLNLSQYPASIPLALP